MRNQLADNLGADEAAHRWGDHHRDQTEAVDNEARQGKAIWRIQSPRQCERAQKRKRYAGNRQNVDPDHGHCDFLKLRWRDGMSARHWMKTHRDHTADCSDN